MSPAGVATDILVAQCFCIHILSWHVGLTWIVLYLGGGPTDDKPDVTLAPPENPNKVSSFLNIRVADIQKCYREWSERGAEFLTEVKDHEREFRCYMKDPDGYIIEVRQIKL